MSDSESEHSKYAEVSKLIMQHLYSKCADGSCVQELERIVRSGHDASCSIHGNLSICTCGFEEAQEYLKLLRKCEG